MRDYDLVMSMPVKKRGRHPLAPPLRVRTQPRVHARVHAPRDDRCTSCTADSRSGRWARFLLATLCAPLAPLAVALTLGTLLSALTAGFRYRNTLRAVFGILVFGALMALYFWFSFSASEDMGADLANIADVLIGKAYPPALLLRPDARRRRGLGGLCLCGRLAGARRPLLPGRRRMLHAHPCLFAGARREKGI